ncbi:MAG TPA: TAXI family TRAP transporter solute-binding subunit [Aliidongia sp.]|nr:TAXI family TRAP transporter solute-binding subunit [Aliidongia sp.]
MISAPLAGAQADDPNKDARVLAKHGGIGIITGGIDGTYLRVAADLAAVLDGESQLRVLPMIGKGSVQNLFDLRYLRNVDIAIVQSDALAFIRQDPSTADVSDYVRYVTKLYNEEFQVLATKDIQSLEDLRGKKVNTDLVGSGTGMTSGIVFGQLGIPIAEQHLGQADAIQALKTGDISAAVFVAGKPVKLFSSIDGSSGLHFLAVSPTPALLGTYLPAQLSHEDYPQLIPEGTSLDTVAVGAVMAIFNLRPGTDRFHQAEAFVDAFFSKFDKFLLPPRHPKWHEVNLAADLPGWKRFDPAIAWLDQHGKTASNNDDEIRKAFEGYLDRQAELTASPPPSAEEKAALYARFQQWQKATEAANGSRSQYPGGRSRGQSRQSGNPPPS